MIDELQREIVRDTLLDLCATLGAELSGTKCVCGQVLVYDRETNENYCQTCGLPDDLCVSQACRVPKVATPTVMMGQLCQLDIQDMLWIDISLANAERRGARHWKSFDLLGPRAWYRLMQTVGAQPRMQLDFGAGSTIDGYIGSLSFDIHTKPEIREGKVKSFTSDEMQVPQHAADKSDYHVSMTVTDEENGIVRYDGALYRYDVFDCPIKRGSAGRPDYYAVPCERLEPSPCDRAHPVRNRAFSKQNGRKVT